MLTSILKSLSPKAVRSLSRPSKSAKPNPVWSGFEHLEDRVLFSNTITTPVVAPGFGPGTLTVPIGSTIQIPINDSNTNNDQLSYHVSSDNPNVSVAVRQTTNTFINFHLTGGVTGDIVFQIFNDVTPNTASYFASYVQSLFYTWSNTDNSIINRVIKLGGTNDSLIVQAGSSNGTNGFDPGFSYPEEIVPGLVYSGYGQLGLARGGGSRDSGSTQFFFTAGPANAQSFDYQYTLFGQIVRGFDVLNQFQSIALAASQSSGELSVPVTPIKISTASIFQDTSDAVLVVSANSSATSATPAHITVTTSDTEGNNSAPLVFAITPQQSNLTLPDPIILVPQPSSSFITAINTPITITQNIVNPFGYGYDVTPSLNTPNANVIISSVTKLSATQAQFTITPTNGFTGQISLKIVAEYDIPISGQQNFIDTSRQDFHNITVAVGDHAIAYSSVGGLSFVGNNANYTVATFSNGTAASAAQFSATINWQTGQAPTTGTIVDNGNGTFSVVGVLPYTQAGVYAAIVTVTSTAGAVATSNAINHIVSAASHTNHQTYVAQLYIDLLGRQADSGGLAAWTALLDGGQNFSDIALAITGSREYDGIIVDSFYVKYLNRHAETAGLNGWVDRMQTGLNAEVIRAGILGSQEYYNDTGPGGNNGTDITFVTALYLQFLNRAPDPGGLHDWLAILNNDPNQRQPVANGISNSDENRTDIVTAFYETYLHRAPDSGGLAYWKGLLANGISQPLIIAAFVTSPEYLNRYGVTNS